MNNDNNTQTATIENTKTTETTTADALRTIAFRAECAADAEAIRALMAPWTVSYSVESLPLKHNGEICRGVDVEARMTLTPDAPTVSELRFIWDAIPNTHIAADTLQPLASYTGDREPRCGWTGDVKRPPKQALSEALAAVAQRQAVLQLELQRMQRAHNELLAMHKLGARWTPPVSDGEDPALLCIVTHRDSGLHRVVAVHMRGAARKLSAAKQRKVADDRVLVIRS